MNDLFIFSESKLSKVLVFFHESNSIYTRTRYFFSYKECIQICRKYNEHLNVQFSSLDAELKFTTFSLLVCGVRVSWSQTGPSHPHPTLVLASKEVCGLFHMQRDLIKAQHFRDLVRQQSSSPYYHSLISTKYFVDQNQYYVTKEVRRTVYWQM